MKIVCVAAKQQRCVLHTIAVRGCSLLEISRMQLCGPLMLPSLLLLLLLLLPPDAGQHRLDLCGTRDGHAHLATGAHVLLLYTQHLFSLVCIRCSSSVHPEVGTRTSRQAADLAVNTHI
jgi:hypothetical protein